jgi:addiction module HigA family antidote
MLREFLNDVGISQAECARRLNIRLVRLNEVVKNKRGITADTALRLGEFFGTSAQFWLNVQDAWDVWHAVSQDATRYGAIRQRRPRTVRKAAAAVA